MNFVQHASLQWTADLKELFDLLADQGNLREARELADDVLHTLVEDALRTPSGKSQTYIKQYVSWLNKRETLHRYSEYVFSADAAGNAHEPYKTYANALLNPTPSGDVQADDPHEQTAKDLRTFMAALEEEHEFDYAAYKEQQRDHLD